VVSVRAQRPGDVLSPGLRAFSFGVDVATDAGGDTDDNVVQRGLSDDLGQYKIELDRGLFTCTVKGADGRVTARLSEPRPEAGVWYRIHCRREGGTVDLKVTRLDTGEVATTTSTGSIGEVRTADPTAPLSIGGKLTQVGAIAAWAPDQFDGALDNVWLRID
jgi:hypothetical protein